MALGLRVVRGPDWCYGDQDGGEGHLGTVIKQDNDSVSVLWDMGDLTICRIGEDGKYDLRVFDNAPIGVGFMSSRCSSCQKDGFFGMKWNCKTCEGVCLCSVCYTQGKHDEKHTFIRYYAPGSIGVDVPKRSVCIRMRSLGIFPGAKVVRGRHWDWKDQDGGKEGTVVGFRSEGFADRNCVAVQWLSGSCYKYRLGSEGKVDLKCKEEAPGFDYYRDHLPVLDLFVRHRFAGEKSEHNEFKVNDKVCIQVNKEQMKADQKGHGGWTNRMEEILNKIGTVKGFTKNGDVVVTISENKGILNPTILRKVNNLEIGDHVEILDGKETVKLLQVEHGEWVDDLEEILGKVGKVVRFTPKGDAVVAFGRKTFVLHPGCCMPAEEDAELYEISTRQTPQENEGIGLEDALGLMLAQMLLGGTKVFGKEEFIQAAAKGDVALVQKILRKNSGWANEVVDGKTALVLSSYEGHDEVVKLLLNAKADTELQDSKGATPLLAAALGKQLSTTKLLIKNGANVDYVNPAGRTVLHIAVNAKTADIVEVLLQNKCNVNVQDNDDDTPLHDAISVGQEDIILKLIKAPGVDFRISNKNGFNILMFATLKNRAVELITSKCPRMVDDAKVDGFTALHLAAFNNHTQIAVFLLSHCEVNPKCNSGRTPLFYAAHKGFYVMVKILLDHGADVKSRDKDDNTALHAVLSGNPAEQQLLLMVLLGTGRRISSAEKVKIASLLIQFGASIDDKNKQNKSPIDICPEQEVRRAVVKCAKETKSSKQSRERPSTGGSERTLFQRSNIMCLSCFGNQAEITYKPCSHRVHCLQCTFEFDECPVCETDIEKRLDKVGNIIVPLVDPCRVQ